MENIMGWTLVVIVIIGFAAALRAGKLIHQNHMTEGNNEIPQNNPTQNETGPMIYFANNRYGQQDNEFRFNYKKTGSTWRAYILKMPNLGNRDSSGVVTHRLYDNGNPYVCWDRQVNTLKDMQTISKHWADCIQEYIATGKRFG